MIMRFGNPIVENSCKICFVSDNFAYFID